MTKGYFAELSLIKRVNNLHAVDVFPCAPVIYCCKEKIYSYLVYCTLLAGHNMGDPFEISTIRREVSLFVLLTDLEIRMRFNFNFVCNFYGEK